jgi:hypothetical protein
MVLLNKEEDEKENDDKDFSGLLIMVRSVFR